MNDNATIDRMTREIPVTLLWDKTLYVAIRNVLDSDKAQTLMDDVLQEIVDNRAQSVIFDILGVQVVDTAVANHIIMMSSAMKLLGCQLILCGISPMVAQTIVQLGVELDGIVTTPTGQDALKLSLRYAGYEVVPSSDAGLT